MHPQIKSQNLGLCPECGMNLIPQKDEPQKVRRHKPHGEFDKHQGHSLEIFAKKFWLSLALTIPVIIYSELPEKLFNLKAPQFSGSNYLSLVLSSIVFFWGGWIFIEGAARELKAKLPGMMTLIALAISAAYLYSLFAILITHGATLFWELTTLITVMLLGHLMEMKAVQGAQGALKELSKLLPDTAEVQKGTKTQKIPLSELKTGDVVFVRPGGKIPADGQVIEGNSEVNESVVTGESKPLLKVVGSEVIAGTVNGDGALKIKVTKIGDNTFLAGIMRLVIEAQASKSRLQILSDKAASYLTLIAIASGLATFLAWLIARSGFVFAIERLVAVLVIACPHALGLAVPLVASISTTLAARNGLLVRQRLALETARNIDIVLFDKTGTLTKGEYGIDRIWSITYDEKEVLKLAASVDSASEHFIAKAIVEKARSQKILFSKVQNFRRIPGKGVKGTIDGQEISVGGEAILSDTQDQLSRDINQEIKKENLKGKTIIYVLQDKKIIGVIALSDQIRPESPSAIAKLQKMQVKVAMITGDNLQVAQWVAKELKIDEYFANVLPHQKAQKVKILQERGLKVAMVGDGINDAPALAQADIGIAIGAGTNVAIESAGIILVRNDPQDIAKVISLSRETFSKMIQNLFWATGYNVIALPMAAGVFATKGIILQPALAALFMSLSTVIVAINALLLKKVRL